MAPDSSNARSMTLTPIAPSMGAVVSGLDLSVPLSEAQAAGIRKALQDHHLLCFRGLEMSAEEQVAFSRQIGALEVFPEEDKTKDENVVYNVANVSPDGEHMAIDDHRVTYQLVNARWHTDSSYRYIPSYCSIMLGIEVLPEDAKGGETEFSNMLMAYDALSPEMKARLEPLFMVHYYEYGRRLYPQLPPVSHHERVHVPPTCHPLVRVHPDRDNARSLFITVNAGNEISGMSLEDGQALHAELQEHISRPEFRYSHRWQAGDLVIWDNRVVLHRAAAYDMGKYRRVFRRTTVAGDGPVLGPFSQAIQG